MEVRVVIPGAFVAVTAVLALVGTAEVATAWLVR